MSRHQHNSLKKFNVDGLRNRHLDVLENLERIIKSQERLRSQRKNRSSDRNQEAVVRGKKLMSGRLRTEADEQFAHLSHRMLDNKNPYQKLAQFRKKKTITDDSDIKNKKQLPFSGKPRFNNFQTAASNLHQRTKRGLFLNQTYLSKNLRKPQVSHPATSKASSRPKINERSDRSIKRKLQLEEYTSESLEKLNMSYHRETEDSRKKNQRTLEKTSKNRERTIHQEMTGKVDKVADRGDRTEGEELGSQRDSDDEDYNFRPVENEFQEKGRRIKTEMGDSRQKLDIVFEKRKPSRKPNNPYDLSTQQLETFGDRFPQSFQKIKLLGRGGFSLVWLGQHKKSKKQFAIKQIRTQNNHQTHIKQIWFGTYFFQMGGLPKKQFSKHPGIKNLVKIYSYDINKSDTWIFYEKCGESLGNALYDLRGDSYVGERLYRSVYKPLYHRIRNSQHELRRIMVEVARALQLLAENKIVHSDLKTENILIRLKYAEQTEENMAAEKDVSLIEDVKLIDYGSSFTFSNLKQFSMATPEYMAPEILNYILFENQLEYAPKLLEFLKNYHNPWVIDMWSLGCVLLEIVSGIPLWMSLKTLVRRKGCDMIKYGLFAVKGRLFDKIIKKQIEVVQNLEHYLVEENYSGIVLEPDLKQALKRMLSIDPSQRISPTELIKLLTPQPSP